MTATKYCSLLAIHSENISLVTQSKGTRNSVSMSEIKPDVKLNKEKQLKKKTII
jgi:hypothetical protein